MASSTGGRLLEAGFESITGDVPVPERLHDDGYRTMEFGSSNFPSLERGDWGSGKVCVWGGRAHTRTHSFSPLWSSSASSPAQLWDVPTAGSCFFLRAALFLAAAAAAGAANLNHHFARLILYDRLSADCGHLSTKVPTGICNPGIAPQTQNTDTQIFRLLLHCAALFLVVCFLVLP